MLVLVLLFVALPPAAVALAVPVPKPWPPAPPWAVMAGAMLVIGAMLTCGLTVELLFDVALPPLPPVAVLVLELLAELSIVKFSVGVEPEPPPVSPTT